MGSLWAVDRKANSYLLRTKPPQPCSFNMYLFYSNQKPFVLKTTLTTFTLEFLVGKRYPSVATLEDRSLLLEAFKVFGCLGDGRDGMNIRVEGT